MGNRWYKDDEKDQMPRIYLHAFKVKGRLGGERNSAIE